MPGPSEGIYRLNIYFIHNHLFPHLVFAWRGKKIVLACQEFFLQCSLKNKKTKNTWLLPGLFLHLSPLYSPAGLMCSEGVYFPNQALLSHTCQPLPCFPRPDRVVFHISTMQIQLRLISLTWEKFLALILTSFSTSCCRWKVSSCSLFSASSLLLLSSSSIWRRARLSRSWEDSTFIKYFFWSVSRLHRKNTCSALYAARTQLDIHTFMHIFSCCEPLATAWL